MQAGNGKQVMDKYIYTVYIGHILALVFIFFNEWASNAMHFLLNTLIIACDH